MRLKNIKFLILFVISFENSIVLALEPNREIDCSRQAYSIPNPKLPVGKKNPSMPIEHVIVIMQENHSFDQYFGKLNKPEFYGNQVDGLSDKFYNKDLLGRKYFVQHSDSLCLKDPFHQWSAEHMAWNHGENDSFLRFTGFMRAKPNFVMSYFDETDLPFYYALANTFAISDRYFSSGLVGTNPNRFFLLTGTSMGQTHNFGKNFKQKTIFELLDDYHISWRYYTDGKGYLSYFEPFHTKSKKNQKSIAQYEKDVREGTLPQIAFIDSKWYLEDEHPTGNIQKGQEWVANKIIPLLKSSSWASSAIFFTYDENGGFFDHVPPPRACLPDDIKIAKVNKFNRLGFRVPFVAISPYAKRHYVSHMTYDHTSILKFIETLYNLPALTRRDANANDLLDLFDFGRPNFEVPPLPSGAMDPKRKCGRDKSQESSR